MNKLKIYILVLFLIIICPTFSSADELENKKEVKRFTLETSLTCKISSKLTA
jgi:hypothetical protein